MIQYQPVCQQEPEGRLTLGQFYMGLRKRQLSKVRRRCQETNHEDHRAVTTIMRGGVATGTQKKFSERAAPVEQWRPCREQKQVALQGGSCTSSLFSLPLFPDWASPLTQFKWSDASAAEGAKGESQDSALHRIWETENKNSYP